MKKLLFSKLTGLTNEMLVCFSLTVPILCVWSKLLALRVYSAVFPIKVGCLLFDGCDDFIHT